MGEPVEPSGPNDLRGRTKTFALRVIRLFGALPKTTEAQIVGKQALRSATSIGAHYREASRARSNAEFVSKIEVALQELEETAYWFELMVDGEIVPRARLADLQRENDELIAIFVTIANKAKRRK